MANEQTRDESSIKLYPHQVAGQFQTGFKLTSDGLLMKAVQRPPKGEREVVFYDTIFNEKEDRIDILQLRRFLPQFYGTVKLACKDDTSQHFLLLEDITKHFSRPCVMDIKIGKVTWDDHVDDAFKQKRRKKWPIQEIAGFSVQGFMIYNHKTHCYEHCPLDWLKTLVTLDDVQQQTFVKYLKGVREDPRRIVLERINANLMEIKQWFLTQRFYKFLRSSLLIVYEGDTMSQSHDIHSNMASSCSQQQHINNQTPDVYPLATSEQKRHLRTENVLVEARMIDMAHVFETSELDDNYLFGLDNVIASFKQLQTCFK